MWELALFYILVMSTIVKVEEYLPIRGHGRVQRSDTALVLYER